MSENQNEFQSSPIKDFLGALMLLTILPVSHASGRISPRSMPYYPLVGLLIGAFLAIAYSMMRHALPPLVTGAIIVALWAVITGGLHLDGFIDSCDGLFAVAPKERRLEIMKDVHVGSFGAVGILLLIILKVAAVSYLQGAAFIILAPILGRWAVSYVTMFPKARKEGLGVLTGSGISRREILISTIIALTCALALHQDGVLALIGAFIAATVIAKMAMMRLGGLTGDIYGMTCETVEALTLVIGLLTIQ